ncbi:hypothetical protein [Achromobacter spanius]|uniref:DUF3995 domain-containing protein n=1 Tax=Achromobacter spanius TaxID=217203 RepID=A0AAW3I4Z1_9BURK|nr:hypothetical protein [Achromobacter spanius]KNE27821.1 hypothetical protein AFM18_09855 [Achromobacter spanius]
MWISAGAVVLALLAIAAWGARVAGRSGGKDAARHPWRARVGAVLCLGLSAFFYYAWYAFYWKWDFNKLGRYYDPVDQVVYTSSGFVWVLPATASLIAGLALAWRGWRHRAR